MADDLRLGEAGGQARQHLRIAAEPEVVEQAVVAGALAVGRGIAVADFAAAAGAAIKTVATDCFESGHRSSCINRLATPLR
ncbi:MAG TPA: hypothetical protein VM182_01370 [Terriglobia bacterium]|nr:hypothetical protein [Terriglobia bacterium]